MGPVDAAARQEPFNECGIALDEEFGLILLQGARRGAGIQAG